MTRHRNPKGHVPKVRRPRLERHDHGAVQERFNIMRMIPLDIARR